CKHTALYGSFSDSSADRLKRQEFLALTDGECFDNPGSLAACWEHFRPHAKNFDSVLCVNDIAAASLIHHLHGEGIRVPQDIQVACFGSSEIARLYKPAITSVTLDNMKLGRQVVSIYAYLQKADPSVSVSVRVEGKLIVRDSTRPIGLAPTLHERYPAKDDAPNFYEDDEVLLFTRLEKLLASCDALDREIIAGQLAGDSSEQLSERLNLAPETIRYRMRRLTQQLGMDSRSAMLDFLRESHFAHIFGTSGENKL
ncbi:MAG: substrate-binding domain-containing protein, partial [Clostridia bacterium]|nr:substrate-binding domain-containing protein [Clostridia bacterium]